MPLAAREPSRGTMLKRGFVKHCPLCGSGHLFRRWTQMADHCPRCGHHFERKAEEGFFLGAYVINFAVTQAALIVVLAAYIVIAAGSETDIGLTPFVVAGLVAAFVVPVIGYPFSKTVWSAIDLVMHPPDVDEEAEAFLHRGDGPHPD